MMQVDDGSFDDVLGHKRTRRGSADAASESYPAPFRDFGMSEQRPILADEPTLSDVMTFSLGFWDEEAEYIVNSFDDNSQPEVPAPQKKLRAEASLPLGGMHHMHAEAPPEPPMQQPTSRRHRRQGGRAKEEEYQEEEEEEDEDEEWTESSEMVQRPRSSRRASALQASRLRKQSPRAPSSPRAPPRKTAAPEVPSSRRQAALLWRKYGQKNLRGKPWQGVVRCYYKCRVSTCPAKKLVEKHKDNLERIVDTKYIGNHNHQISEEDLEDAGVPEEEEEDEIKARGGSLSSHATFESEQSYDEI